MDNDQKAEMGASDRVKAVVKKYETEFATILEFGNFNNEFNNTKTLLDNALGLQEKETGGIMPLVLSKRETMAETICTFTLRASVLVSGPEHIDLFTAIDKPMRYYLLGSKISGVERAKDTRDALQDNLVIFTNITPENIAEIDAAILDYDTNKDEPGNQIRTKKALATDVIPDLLARNILARENIYKLALSYFKKKNPKIVNEMALAKHVVNTAVRHTSILFNFMDEKTKEPIINVTVTDESNKKTYTTDDSGIIQIPRHRSGQFHFTVITDGKPKKDYLAIIKGGVENHFEIVL